MKHTKHVRYGIHREGHYKPVYIGPFRSRRLARKALKMWLRYDICGNASLYSIIGVR